VKTLNLHSIEMDAAGLTGLFGAKGWPSLTTLNLSGNDLRGAEFLRAGESLIPKQVQTLSLFGCKLGNGGIAALARANGFHELRVLRLGLNGLTDDAALHLARASSLSMLWALDLQHNREFGDAGLRALLDGLPLDELHELRVEGTAVTRAGLEYAKQKLPRLKILVHPDHYFWM
jgi:hypothetical protein